jgi:hypothetical protein
MNTKNISLFLKLAIATIQGDDSEAKAIKIQKKAIAYLTAQIAAKVCHTLSLEEKVESATQELANARVNGGELITDNTAYIRSLLKRRLEKTQAEQELEEHLEEIAFLEEELAIAKK